MKKLLLVLLLTLSTNLFADEIYCPQTISCVNKTCYGVPDNFYISDSFGKFSPNATFYFYEANSMQVMQAPYTCKYATNVQTKETGISITSRKPIKADTNLALNNWFNMGQGDWAKWGGIYFCYYNAKHCPFMDY
jgi:hypothetical protein